MRKPYLPLFLAVIGVIMEMDGLGDSRIARAMRGRDHARSLVISACIFIVIAIVVSLPTLG